MIDSNQPTEAEEKKQEREPRPWPKRYRPKNHYSEAVQFFGRAIKHQMELGDPLSARSLDKLKPLFNNYCWNIGLRGSDKTRVWALVESEIRSIKAR